MRVFYYLQLALFLSLFFIHNASSESDWGYDINPAPRTKCLLPKAPIEKRPIAGLAQKENQNQHLALMQPITSPSNQDKATQAVACWLEIFEFVSNSRLLEGQKAHYRKFLLGEIRSARQQEMLTVLDFWPDISLSIKNCQEESQSYKDLMRALLRVLERRNAKQPLELTATAQRLGEVAAVNAAKPKGNPKKTETIDNQEAEEIFSEILGPLAIAQTGCPPLTEDAINAYADMACFLYEQTHPGKTLDATDNRLLFAKLICERYREAPSTKDKEAMVNFDVTWAIFKLLWKKADADDRQALIAHWSGVTATPLAAKIDANLDKLLRQGPWGKIIFAGRH